MNDPRTQTELDLKRSGSQYDDPVPEQVAGEAFSEARPFRLSPSAQVLDRPGLAHTVVFFVLALLILFFGEIATVAIGSQLPSFRHKSVMSLASDARLMIPSQALQYAVLLGLTTLIFRAIWHQPFWKAIQWNASAAVRRWVVLIATGGLLGLASSLASNYLPMPKEAPILNDLMNSTTGAWLMFFFGTTGAPLIEELAFRGFLLPSLVNTSRRFLSADAVKTIGIPVSILLTSAPFALLHSLQVSYAWAPVMLIGLVSVALCIVRLWTNSLAASTLVHATYNFCLFTGMLVASDGFRHLEKLNN